MIIAILTNWLFLWQQVESYILVGKTKAPTLLNMLYLNPVFIDLKAQHTWASNDDQGTEGSRYIPNPTAP
jgi:hypothetical protein